MKTIGRDMKINIDDIENSKDKRLEITFDDCIDGVPTKGNIKADLVFQDLDVSIHVTGKIEAGMIVQCRRCLEEFVYESSVDVDECYYKTNLFPEYKQERELKYEAIGEDLNGSGEIDVEDLIYQSLILSVPNDCVCDINCNGGMTNLKDYISPKEDIR